MAVISIVTTEAEQELIVQVLKTLVGQTVAMSAIAKLAKMNPNRVRYVVTDLEEAGRIRKVPTKAFNEHYIRYRYEVLQ